MAKSNMALVGVALVVALLLGGLIGMALLPAEKVEVKVQDQALLDKVAALEAQLAEPVAPLIEIREVEVDSNSILLADSEEALLDYLDDEDLLEDFDLDQVSVKKVEVFKVDLSDDDEIVVEIELKLRLRDADFDEKETMVVSAEIVFEDGEDPDVNDVEIEEAE